MNFGNDELVFFRLSACREPVVTTCVLYFASLVTKLVFCSMAPIMRFGQDMEEVQNNLLTCSSCSLYRTRSDLTLESSTFLPQRPCSIAFSSAVLYPSTWNDAYRIAGYKATSISLSRHRYQHQEMNEVIPNIFVLQKFPYLGFHKRNRGILSIICWRLSFKSPNLFHHP